MEKERERKKREGDRQIEIKRRRLGK